VVAAAAAVAVAVAVVVVVVVQLRESCAVTIAADCATLLLAAFCKQGAGIAQSV
jgi:hypothetical protein